MPGSFLSLQQQRVLGSLGRLWREGGGRPFAVHAGGSQGDGARLPLGKAVSRWVFAQGIRSWAVAAPLAMAAKVDLTTSTDWKEAKSFLKGLNNKQRRSHYFTKDFIKLKQIPTWKEMAKSESFFFKAVGISDREISSSSCCHLHLFPLSCQALGSSNLKKPFTQRIII
uniref:Uncharacterized protein n=1 Tax=Pseudonaja textilis TaxID=8673 RepID=A0A670ZP70_PSETE